LRIAVCATHPIQYHTSIWRHLAATEGIKPHLFFGSNLGVREYHDAEFGTKVAWDTPLTKGYDHTFLSAGSSIQKIDFGNPGSAGLKRALQSFNPEIVLLTAYHGRFHLAALFAARGIGAKVIMRHEASDSAVTRSRLKGYFRDQLLRFIYRRVDGFAVIGMEASNHLARLGVPDSKLEKSPYCVDSEFFAEQIDHWHPKRSDLRSELGIGPRDLALVFSGKLIAKKDPLLICSALALCNADVRERIHLLVAGDGELRKAFENASRKVLGARVHFFGFVNQKEIGRLYAAGDLLVLPSRRGAGETWGLVVNEAMQFGLGAIVSDGVGCGPDLVTEETGRIFEAHNAASAAECLEDCAKLLRLNSGHFANAARVQVSRFSVGSAANGIVALSRRISQEYPGRRS
jgi:glycosyltransferase involved in cell wall biosynthesis